MSRWLMSLILGWRRFTSPRRLLRPLAGAGAGRDGCSGLVRSAPGLWRGGADALSEPGSRVADHDPVRAEDSRGATGRWTCPGRGGEVRELRERGVEPEEILVLFRHWSDEGDLALETLRSWGIAAHSNDSRSLTLSRPCPHSGWRSRSRLRIGKPSALSACSATAWSAPPGRGRPACPGDRGLYHQGQPGLPRPGEVAPRPGYASGAARTRRSRVQAGKPGQTRRNRLLAVLTPLDQPRRWVDQVCELRRVAGELGMTAAIPCRLDPLWDALDDQADVLERLGRGARSGPGPTSPPKLKPSFSRPAYL